MPDLNNCIKERLVEVVSYISEHTPYKIELVADSAIIKHSKLLPDGTPVDYGNTTITVSTISTGGRRYGYNRSVKQDVVNISIHHQFTRQLKYVVKADKKITEAKIWKLRNELVTFENSLVININSRHEETIKKNAKIKKFKDMFPMLDESQYNDNELSKGNVSINLVGELTMNTFNVNCANISREQALQIIKILNPDIEVKMPEEIEEDKKKSESRFDMINEEWK